MKCQKSYLLQVVMMKDIHSREVEVKRAVDQVAERDGEIQRLQQQIQVRNLSIKDTSLIRTLLVVAARERSVLNSL